MMMEHKDDQLPSSSTSASSSFHFNGTSTYEDSSDLADDASSSSFSSSSCQSASPLYGLYSDLIIYLPIKRGLSKHYNGKSQSFTCLSKVMSAEDLVKKERFLTGKVKATCKSIGAGLDHNHSPTLPKPAICKKSSRSTHLSFLWSSPQAALASAPSPRQSNLQCSTKKRLC